MTYRFLCRNTFRCSLCFSLVSGLCTVCLGLFTRPLGLGRLCSVIVALPGYNPYYSGKAVTDSEGIRGVSGEPPFG